MAGNVHHRDPVDRGPQAPCQPEGRATGTLVQLLVQQGPHRAHPGPPEVGHLGPPGCRVTDELGNRPRERQLEPHRVGDRPGQVRLGELVDVVAGPRLRGQSFDPLLEAVERLVVEGAHDVTLATHAGVDDLVARAEPPPEPPHRQAGDTLFTQQVEGRVPHGGYLAALAGRAAVTAAEQPDIFTLTTHYLAKATVGGAITFHVDPLGASRRFRSVQVRGVQGQRTVLVALASLGDRSQLDGPTWTSTAPWRPRPEHLSAAAGHPDHDFPAPAVAEQVGLRLDHATSGFLRGESGEQATMRAATSTDTVDQFTALIACDVTPPALWNALPPTGWAPTVELTAHVRTRPAPGPMTIEVSSSHLQDGFFDEDALVRDAAGTLVVQSRQLARWSQPA